MVSLLPPGAGDQGPKGPVREPLHPDEREGRAGPGSAPPPSERGGRVVRDHEGVGVFRLAAWGWGLTIALALFVGAIIVIGYLRDDPGRNPAPAAYRTAVCAAVVELRAGTDALERGVAKRDDDEFRESAREEVLTHVAAANAALADLPEWIPGRSMDELLGAQIITLTNGAGALESGPVESDLEVARGIDGDIAGHLSSGRYGFTCD